MGKDAFQNDWHEKIDSFDRYLVSAVADGCGAGALVCTGFPRSGGDPCNRTGGGDRNAQPDGHKASADDRFGRRTADRRAGQRTFAAARIDGAGTGAVRCRPRRDGIRRVGRRCRPVVGTRYRRTCTGGCPYDGYARADRRSSAVHGAVRSPRVGCLPVLSGRARGGAARTGLRAVRFQCDGGRCQYRDAQDGGGRCQDACRGGLRLL